MIRLLLGLLLALMMPFSGALAMMRAENAIDAARTDFPDWEIWDTMEYGSGRWENEMAWHEQISLMKIEGEWLHFRQISAMLNPLEEGQAVPWEVEDWASLPLSSEAAERLAQMDPKSVMDQYRTQVSTAALPGCGEFLLGEGEKMAELYVYPRFLLAITEDALGRQGFRIGHWNGQRYDKITASPMQNDPIWLNRIHSWDDYLEIALEDGVAMLTCEADGEWKLSHVNNGLEVYSIRDSGIMGYDEYLPIKNNWLHYYGRPLFPWKLEELQLDSIPMNLEDAALLLDADGFACVEREGAKMHEEIDGEVIARCYQKLTGTIAQEEGEWVCLQLGTEEMGMQGWFRREDLAFGQDVNAVECTFPSYSSWAFEQMEADPYETVLWLVGKTEAGDWLTLIDEEKICILPADQVYGIGSTEMPEYLR
ncbi:MAG: hypothetical protein E7329_09180 [Clostridiales bacterium]|nr:hypothetical protein [Clostridiales bacterium]